jgi:hypothetical protein
MNTLRKEVRDLIALNERIQSALLRGERITDTEIEIIRTCSTELLARFARADGPKMEWRDGDSLDGAIDTPNPLV